MTKSEFVAADRIWREGALRTLFQKVNESMRKESEVKRKVEAGSLIMFSRAMSRMYRNCDYETAASLICLLTGSSWNCLP